MKPHPSSQWPLKSFRNHRSQAQIGDERLRTRRATELPNFTFKKASKQNQKVARRLWPSRNESVITVIHQSTNHRLLNPFHALRRHCQYPYQIKAKSRKSCYQNSEGRPRVSRCVSISYVTSPQLDSTRIRYGHCEKLFTSFFSAIENYVTVCEYFLVNLWCHGLALQTSTYITKIEIWVGDHTLHT